MRKASVFQKGCLAGILKETSQDVWRFTYAPDYDGDPVSLTMPVCGDPYEFTRFPPVFEGLLPEGVQLEALLRKHKIDRHDAYGQLMVVGEDVVGSLVVRSCTGDKGTENE